MVDTIAEIKPKEPQKLQKPVEIYGYWDSFREVEERTFFDQKTRTEVTIQSIGVLGIPVIEDSEEGTKRQDSYHLTKSGQVVRVRWETSIEGDDILDKECKIDIIGSNGKIESPEDNNPNEPNQVKLIYEPKVKIE